MTSATPSVFAALKFPAETVNPRSFVEKGTRRTKTLAYATAGVVGLMAILLTWGAILIAVPIGWLGSHLDRKRRWAKLKGSAIAVGPDQFSEIHACAGEFARRLGMGEVPAVFVITGNVRNAGALRIGSRRVIVLVEDVVDACARSTDPRTLGFILAHEMAHHALGHTSRFQHFLGRSYKKLSRLNEFTCDAVARVLVAEPQIAVQGLLMLMIGPQLAPHVNLEAIMRQAREVATDKNSVKSENRLTHPLLLRRVHRMLG